MIRKWWEARQRAKSKKRFNAGYEYAVVALVRGEETETSLLVMTHNPFDRTEFDVGIEAGIHALACYVHEHDADSSVI